MRCARGDEICIMVGAEKIYTVCVSSEKVSWAVLLNVGDRVEVTCRESEDGAALREAESVTVLTGGAPAQMPELPAEPDTTPETTPDTPPDAGAGEAP